VANPARGRRGRSLGPGAGIADADRGAIFTLPEAQIVDINGEHEGFLLIKTAAGRSGWAPNANLALIVPKRP
jgi:hypothetical protein